MGSSGFSDEEFVASLSRVQGHLPDVQSHAMQVTVLNYQNPAVAAKTLQQFHFFPLRPRK